MCIRDRFQAHNIDLSQDDATPFHRSPENGKSESRFIEPYQLLEKLGEGGMGTVWMAQQSKPCLLYTSDAADERSSVDLGGRRIIKKKKSTE